VNAGRAVYFEVNAPGVVAISLLSRPAVRLAVDDLLP
jgi:hypothetical protein